MSNNGLMEVVRQRFSQTQNQINSIGENVDYLNEKTERAGEADGFRQYLLADLPFAVDGMLEVRFAFVTDGLDIGETTGNGTGVAAVYKPALDDWYRIADNSVVVN